jgi:pimeloyl-ACP methyl ester carboxylesterase
VIPLESNVVLQAAKHVLSRLLRRPLTSATPVDPLSVGARAQGIAGFRETLAVCQGAELCVRTFGDSAAPPVVCWHGFARTGTDFCTLATALASSFYVICPDTPGRGSSEWLFPSEYTFARYQAIAVDLIAQFAGARRVHWIGTSMGGALGMMLAAAPQSRHLINRLVLNDIGPEVPQTALDRIQDYTGEPQSFENYRAAKRYFETIYTPFGALSDDEWDILLVHSLRRTPDGSLTQHYDPNINAQFGDLQNSNWAWTMFASITAPMLVIRGMDSDVLTSEIADRMVGSALRVERLDLPGLGHAPFLNTPDQIKEIQSFISK